MRMWVIYDKPLDFPNSVVVREWTVSASGPVPKTGWPLAIGPSVDAVRGAVPPGTVRVQGPGDDPDPCIVEVWI